MSFIVLFMWVVSEGCFYYQNKFFHSGSQFCQCDGSISFMNHCQGPNEYLVLH